MSDIKIISRWQHCEKIAKELEIDLRVTQSLVLLEERKKGKTRLRGTRSAESVDELLGFLCGLLENAQPTKP